VGGIIPILLAAASAEAAPVRAEAAPVRAEAGCVEVVRPLERGVYPTSRDLLTAVCKGPAAERVFSYDPTNRVVRAARDLAAGEVVAAPPLSLLAGIRPGDEIAIEAHVGPVIVQRSVRAVRPARVGRPVTVRAADGMPFVVAYPGDHR